MFVLKARSEEEAVQRVLICETRALRCEAEFLGLEGTDELAHAEDAWAMRILNEELFGQFGGNVAIGRI